MLRVFRERAITDPIEVDPDAELDIYLRRWRVDMLAYSVGGHEYVLWGADSNDLERVYSDRLYENNPARDHLARAIASEHKKAYTAAWYQLYLSVYFGCPVTLQYVKGGLNEANGYPYQSFGFQRKYDASELAAFAELMKSYCEQHGVSYEHLPIIRSERAIPEPLLKESLLDRTVTVDLQPIPLLTRRRLAGILGAGILSAIDTAKKETVSL
ncbi:MAG: hypothetical protein HY817_05015 [Candidatus Abawacabacteria bacterium]|nr:hypothetical protein [Candidatus Abawacabacteria bacterium]